MNGIFFGHKEKYDMTQPGEVMKEWIGKNSADKLNRKYAIQTLFLSANLYKCLDKVGYPFDTTKLIRSINDAEEEIAVGNDVLKAIKTMKHRKSIPQMRDIITQKEERNKARNITKLKEIITQSVQILEDRKARFDTLLTKMQSLPSYEEDVEKYKKEISEALHMLQ